MAQINKPNLYFNTVLYTGDLQDSDGTGHTQSITGVGFQPDWVWHKGRSNARTHILVDSVRGTTNYNWLISSDTGQELTTNTNGAIKSIDSDGITLENGTDSSSKSNNAGANGETYVFWNWLASNTTESNTDGSITSTVSANTTSGFSIATYTGNNTNAQTIGHGLGVAPKVYIIKRRDSTSAWGMYHGSLGANKYLQLESTNAEATDTGIWNNTAPTSSVLSIGNAGYFNNASGGTYVCYAFAEKKGYSKFGSYEGNGNVDGPFIYLGFKPAFVIIKKYSAANDWHTHDNKRDTFNPETRYLQPNTSAVETNDTGKALDFLSNGFKLRTTHGSHNGATGQFFIYMAFAENPLVGTNNTPATAR